MSRPLASEILAHVQDFNTSMRGRTPPGAAAATKLVSVDGKERRTRSYPCKDCPTITVEPVKVGAVPERCPECRVKYKQARKKADNAAYNQRRAQERKAGLGPSDVGLLTASPPCEPFAAPSPAPTITLEDVARVVSEPGVISIAGKLQHHIHVGARSYVGDTLPEAVGAAIEGEGW